MYAAVDTLLGRHVALKVRAACPLLRMLQQPHQTMRDVARVMATALAGDDAAKRQCGERP